MARIPTHTVEDAPADSQPLLREVVQFSPTGRPLNLHFQMAHSPAVLISYRSLRAATADHGALGSHIGAALMLAAATAVGNDYAVGITCRLAAMVGWTDEQVAALRSAAATGDERVDALVQVVREATANWGNVSDSSWSNAQRVGWTAEQLAEAFAYLGLTVFTAYFLNYAQTEPDLPQSAVTAVETQSR